MVPGMVSILLLALICVSSVVEAACPAYRRPAVNVTLDIAPMQYELRLSINQLNTYRPNTTLSTREARGDILGLHSGDIGWSFSPEFEVIPQRTRSGVCIQIRKMDLTMHLLETIYVASEYPRGTCEFRAVLEHEFKHAQVDRQLLRRWEPRVIRAALAVLREAGTIYVETERQIKSEINRLMELIKMRLNEEMNVLSIQRDRYQDLVDTPSEYRRVHNQCANWYSMRRR